MGAIGIFGGSFDPVHNGHVAIAKAVIEELSLEKLYVIPAAVSPFKTEHAPKGGYDRALLLRAAFNTTPAATVDARELKRGGVSYAIDTVREIAAENPGAKIYFIIGEDSVEGLPRWKDYDELKSLCEFKSYPRTRESSSEIRRKMAAGENFDDLIPAETALLLKYGVSYNPDAKITDAVLAGLKRKDGYCPCRIPKTPEFLCPCDEFKKQLADENFRGLCHCRLYLKA